MGLAKRIGRNDRIRSTLCRIAATYVRLVFATGRWTQIGQDVPRAIKAEGKPLIVAFWHSRLLMMAQTWIGGPFSMLISQHRDGQLIAGTVALFGVHTIAGSTSHGGAAAFRSILKELKAGHTIGITPDGPRGPRQRASGGVIDIARLSGAVIVPLTYSCQGRLLGSWDRFLLPRLFAKGVYVWGEPIAVAKDADAEAARRQLEDALNALMRRADAMTGIATPEPAPEAPA